MKATRSLLVVALATAGLAAGTAQAAMHGGGGGGGHGGGGGGHAMSGGGHGSGGWHGGGSGHGGWHGSAWHGGWHGGHSHYYYGSSVWWGWPLAFGPWYWWGYPYDYYYGSYYPGYPAPGYGDPGYGPPGYGPPAQPYPDGVMGAPEESQSAPVPAGPGTPTQSPTYMNYCDSAKAYFPKVTTCPEGWKFVPAR